MPNPQNQTEAGKDPESKETAMEKMRKFKKGIMGMAAMSVLAAKMASAEAPNNQDQSTSSEVVSLDGAEELDKFLNDPEGFEVNFEEGEGDEAKLEMTGSKNMMEALSNAAENLPDAAEELAKQGLSAGQIKEIMEAPTQEDTKIAE